MMKLWPKSLFGRILLTILAGLLATHLVSVALVWSDRSDLAAKVTGYHAAERIAGIVELLDNHTRAERLTLARSLNVPPLDITLDKPWESMSDQDPTETDFFIRQLNRALDKPYRIQAVTTSREAPWRRRTGADSSAFPEHGMRPPSHLDKNRYGHLGRHGDRGFSVDLLTDNTLPPPPPKRHLVLMARVQIELSDGQVVTFSHHLRRDPIDWPNRVFVLLIIMGLSTAVLTAWSVRLLTRPLRVLSNAAIGLGKNLDQPPLPETGPTEVAAAAGAFNAMQQAIKRYLDARSQMLAALSHDLRLPITRIRLRIESLSDGQLRDKLEDDLADIDTMIDSTLAFLRAGKSNEESLPIHMTALIDSVVADIEALDATITITVTGQAKTPIVWQPQTLRRCLTNLIDNARRYGGGQIDIEIIDERDQITIKIGDRGPGISDIDKERVFEPYIRLESSRAKHTGGTGLGMATARASVRSHGGDVTLEDRKGGGLTVIVTLPRMRRSE